MSGRPITARQRAVLAFIQAPLDERGYPPTMREIGAHMGISSTNGVNDHLRALEKKGYIVRDDTKARGIRIVAGAGPSPTPVDANRVLREENIALRRLLRRMSDAAARLPALSGEMALLLGDVRGVIARVDVEVKEAS